MAQYNLGTIDPAATSGTQLANRLTQWSAAVNSNNSGPTAPTYGVQGMIWMDTGTAGFVTKRVFDGTDWVAVETLNISTNAISFPSVGALGSNVSFAQVASTSGDFWTYGWGGDGNQGVLFMNAARDRYLHYNGAGYFLNGASLTVGGAIYWGTQGAQVGLDGNLYMPWAGQWLSTYLQNLNTSIGQRQPAGDYATHGYNQFGDTQYIYWTGAAKTVFAAQATIGSYDQQVMQLRTNRGSSTGFTFMTCIADYDNTKDTKFKIRGDGAITADGTFAGGGADYAEYFEWEDGNPTNEDRTGYTVAISAAGKMRVAKNSDKGQDQIIGVVSANPTVVGDAQSDRWVGQYLKDTLGRVKTNKVERVYYREQVGWTDPTRSGQRREPVYEMRVKRRDQWPANTPLPPDAETHLEDLPMENPAYNPNATYVSREDRPEWSAVGMVGKLWVRKGQIVGPRWILMQAGSDADYYLVR